ncbi:MAG TPA: MFS transporter [Ginsengibacter sp.]|nr:MFS transporter [Ginsengibacter sp.]HRP44658.1 MFS transporter [Ginsengibacter sp.]
MTEPPNRKNPFEALQIVEFRYLIGGRFLFIMGLRMLSTLNGWWIYLLTNDPFAIGLIGLAEIIPALSLALYAGHKIDQSEKRRLLLRCLLFYFTAVLMLVFISGEYDSYAFSDHTLSYMIYGVIFCTGIIRAFAGPVFSAMLGYIVPHDKLQNATTWNQGTFLSASVTGHATGGVLIALIGISGTLETISVLILLSFLFLYRLRPKAPSFHKGEIKTWESVKEGLRFVYRTKQLLGAFTLDLFAVLFGGAVALIPVYARDILKVGSEGFGLLNGATDMGAILMVILLTLYPPRKKQGRKLLIAVAGFGVCILIFGLSNIFVLSFMALMISGMLDGVSVVIRGTITQLMTPDHMRGRVMSVNSMFVNSSNELGQFESGVTAKLMGTVPAVLFGGCMTIAIAIGCWFKAPALKKMEY